MAQREIPTGITVPKFEGNCKERRRQERNWRIENGLLPVRRGSGAKPPIDPPTSSSSGPEPDAPPNRLVLLLDFLEHPWVLWSTAVVATTVGLVYYTPALLGMALCLAGAFHRKKVVAGLPWMLQTLSYVGVVSVAFFLAWIGVKAGRTGAQDLARNIASYVKAAISPKPAPPDPNYPVPTGRAVRMEGTAVPPSNQMCQGMTDAQQIACLCPSPLDYTLSALPTPPDNNYATEIDIKQGERPIYRLRVFARTMVDARHGFVVDPPDTHSASFMGTFDYDPYSFVLSDTAPKKEFKIKVHSSEGLRLKCINQEN